MDRLDAIIRLKVSYGTFISTCDIVHLAELSFGSLTVVVPASLTKEMCVISIYYLFILPYLPPAVDLCNACIRNSDCFERTSLTWRALHLYALTAHFYPYFLYARNPIPSVI